MSECPYCGEPADTIQDEVIHMQAKHSEVIEQRLVEAGFRREPNGEWIDMLAGDE